MTKKTDLITSTLVARQLTENPYDIVDAEEEMSSSDLAITGDYSDYDILEEEKDAIAEKDDCEYLKIKWTDSRKRGKDYDQECINGLLQKKSVGAHKTR